MKPRIYLWLEMILLFGGLPLVIYFVRERSLMISILWLCGLLGYLALRRHNASFSHIREWNWAAVDKGLWPMFRRFFLLAPLLAAFAYFHDYDRFLSFPRERPMLWATVMIFYPILSVWPQEFVFRSFLFHRYAPLLHNHAYYVLVSALTFGYAHIVFNNWIAITFCTIGGLIFARTYVQHRSLALVCFEHALYGCFIFTIGLGWYFYGTAWQR